MSDLNYVLPVETREKLDALPFAVVASGFAQLVFKAPQNVTDLITGCSGNRINEAALILERCEDGDAIRQAMAVFCETFAGPSPLDFQTMANPYGFAGLVSVFYAGLFFQLDKEDRDDIKEHRANLWEHWRQCAVYIIFTRKS